MKRYNRFMEVVWTSVAIASGIFAAYFIGKHGLEAGKMLLMFPLATGALAGMRYFMRKRMERMDNNK